MAQELEIRVTAEGKVEIRVKGAPGPACEALTKEIEEALGVVIDRQKTSEYFLETEQASVKIGR